MSIVTFVKNASGPSFGPYLAGDVVNLNASDTTKHTGGTDPVVPGQWGTSAGRPSAVLTPNATPTKPGT